MHLTLPTISLSTQGTQLLLPHTHFACFCPTTLRDGARGHAGVGQNARSPLHSHCVRARLRLPRLLCCGHAHQAHTHKRSPKHSHFGKCGDPSRSAQPQRPPAAAPTRPWPAPTPGAAFSPQPPSRPMGHGAWGTQKCPVTADCLCLFAKAPGGFRMPHVPRGAPAGSGPPARTCSTAGCILQVHATTTCFVPYGAQGTWAPSTTPRSSTPFAISPSPRSPRGRTRPSSSTRAPDTRPQL